MNYSRQRETAERTAAAKSRGKPGLVVRCLSAARRLWRSGDHAESRQLWRQLCHDYVTLCRADNRKNPLRIGEKPRCKRVKM